MRKLDIDLEYLKTTLKALLEIPSPSGYTDRVVHYCVGELEKLGLPCRLTRRGGIRATLSGQENAPRCAIVSHLDTVGAMVKQLKSNGRLEMMPIGHWSSRFAEGCRVTIFTDKHGCKRGTILPLKASGHTFNEEIDTQPVAWDNVEIRTNDFARNEAELRAEGYHVGDFVAVDPGTEFTPDGFVVSRHLDDKAGVAAVLAAAKSIVDSKVEVPTDCNLIFTIAEEVGTGASSVLHGNTAELVAVDNATQAPGQNSRERGVTIAMMDSSGPFDYHLTHKLLDLCEQYELEHQRDVFKYYRCDAAAAVEAGNDLRVALVCFGLDASHGYERAHVTGLCALAQLLGLYIQAGRIAQRDGTLLGPLSDFPTQPQ
ncbi:MAG: osmoprotectant NAGGN system M42 family peptidase [Polyangiaceae bacterium]|nr:osmoprotectant NAGGN system M42 family peptidase [Polyangiaceae bacterium]